MRNNAAYLPESPIVYIILPKSIRNRASLRIFVPKIKALPLPTGRACLAFRSGEEATGGGRVLPERAAGN